MLGAMMAYQGPLYRPDCSAPGGPGWALQARIPTRSTDSVEQLAIGTFQWPMESKDVTLLGLGHYLVE